MTERHLAEVSERDAIGTVAQTYADIRTILALPVVNLIYRHLATEPERLEATWAVLRPNLADPVARALAVELTQAADRVGPDVARLTPTDLGAAGVSTDEQRSARATLAVYERGNSLNLLAASALLDGAPGVDGDPAAASSRQTVVAADPIILPMADLSSLEPGTRAILDEMTAAVMRPGEDVLVPSLFRHLATRPALLRLVWAGTSQALSTSALDRASAVHAEARLLARRLPRRVEPVSDPDVRAVLERFAPAMASMLVAGRTIERYLAAAAG